MKKIGDIKKVDILNQTITIKKRAGVNIALNSPVSIIKNPKYHWWTFWRAEEIVVMFEPKDGIK